MRIPSIVRSFASTLVAISLVCLAANTADAPSSGAALDVPTILERINRVGPYEVPDLPLKTNHNYASSSADVEPYGG